MFNKMSGTLSFDRNHLTENHLTESHLTENQMTEIILLDWDLLLNLNLYINSL